MTDDAFKFDPFGRVRLPADRESAANEARADERERADFELRVRYVDEVAKALLEGRASDRSAALFVGSALNSWLSSGGDLVRDCFKLRGRRGSHDTAARVRSRLCDTEAHRNENGEDVSTLRLPK